MMRVLVMFRLAVPNMNSKAVSGHRNTGIIRVLRGYSPVTSHYRRVADGRFSSALFTKRHQTESAF